ncbi:MAG: peroxide stress protein YaaA [Actinobacteria bacterium]|uniref:Unannotated protein n=1 Tax=freshwater metagenome TaxID=449393 RepID=A0A6J6PLR3_9ZZZZ|nr:peroxide stress protein YaaA [Actinomycetota bacterium]
MLILLPPSEGKSQPAGKELLNLSKLVFADQLLEVRRSLVSKSVAKSPAAKAIDVYSGVLYQALDWSSLSATAKARGETSVLIVSAIFGVLRPSDVIPNYKAKIKSSDWKLALKPALDDLAADLIVDCRSSTYASVWQPPAGKTVAVRVFKKEKGKISVITHLSKKYRGELTRELLKSGKTPKSPAELLAIAEKHFDCKLIKAKGNLPWYLDLIINF